MRPTIFHIALTCAALILPWKSSFAGDTFNPGQVNELHKIIREYIINNPDILIEASKTLQDRQQAEQQKESMTGIARNKTDLFNDPNSPSAGNPNGNVMLVEFFDYQCGHCKEMTPVIESILKKDNSIKIIYKELPIFGGASRTASMAALAAEKQGKYVPFHHALLQQTTPLNDALIFKIAKKVGLDIGKLKTDMKSKEVQQQLDKTYQLAQAIKLSGTPTFVIGNKEMTRFRFVPGATTEEEMQKQIKAVQ